MVAHYLMKPDAQVFEPEQRAGIISLEQSWLKSLQSVVAQTTSAYETLRASVGCYLPNAEECSDGSIVFGGITEAQVRRAFEQAKTKEVF